MHLVNKLRLNATGWYTFTKELVSNPYRVGAAFPSSSRLATLMAKQIDDAASGLVIELGGGTGVVTQALLKRNIPDTQLMVIEKSPTFYQYLSTQFPNVKVICGDALTLKELLKDEVGRVNAVVSSLPVRLFNRTQVQALYDNIHGILQPGGRYIQFTYDLRPNRSQISGFKLIHSAYVWVNFPPARIDVFEKTN